jgi:hypothetical protein
VRDAIKMTIRGLKCDAPGCDYRDDTVEFANYKAYINKPCPKCGANLLTEADAKAAVKIARAVKGLNVLWKIFHPVRVLIGPYHKITMTMNGKGFEGIVLYDGEGRKLR